MLTWLSPMLFWPYFFLERSTKAAIIIITTRSTIRPTTTPTTIATIEPTVAAATAPAATDPPIIAALLFEVEFT
jgi:hypothetical protein